MTYSFWFRVDPPGQFGVPEHGRTIVPPGDVIGPTILTSSTVIVGHGTLSKYRADDEALNVPLSLGTIAARFQDNFLMLEIEGDDYEAARTAAQVTADRLLQHVALGFGRSLGAELIAAEDEASKRMPIVKSAEAISVAVYDLDQTRASITQAERSVALDDDRLERALDYYDHALFLINQGLPIRSGVVSRHYDFTVAAIFLNLWKSVTVVIGDPTERDYQSRYRSIGLDYDFFSTRIDRLKQLRDAFDVAHHHLDPDQIEEVKAQFGEAQQIAQEVVSRYRDKLVQNAEVAGG